MLRISRSRGLPRAFSVAALALLAVAVSSDAFGQPRAKKRGDIDLSASERMPLAPASTPVRFFTIKDVLARRDGRKPANAATFASVIDSNVASDAPAATIAPQVSDEPFGLFMFRAPEGLLWTKWRAVDQAMRAEAEAIARCKADQEACSLAASQFVAIAAKATVADPYARVTAVNRAVNQAIRYVSDYEQHGVADRWTPPLATLATGRGDCEDYAILKFAALRDAGVAAQDIRLVLLRDMSVRQDHAALTVRVDGRWLLLDNRSSAMAETSDVPHLMPLFAIDERGVNLFAAPYAARPLHESESDLLPASSPEPAGSMLSAAPMLL